MMVKKIIPKQLGELLIDNELITPDQLEEGLKVQSEKGGMIGAVLVTLGYVSEEAIAQALTAQYGFPYLPLSGYEIDREVSKIIPEEIARQYDLVAVDHVGHVLTVAMSNPLNRAAVDEIEKITAYKVQVFVTTSKDVREAIKRSYKS